MQAVTIVKGEWYQCLADVTVPLFERSTGLSVERVVLGAQSDPYREKLNLAERYKSFVFFDLDCLFLQRWIAEPPKRLSMALGVEWSRCPWDPDSQTRVYNTGVMLVPEGCAPLFRRARDIYDAEGPDHFDEGPLRRAIRELDWSVDELEPRFNWQSLAPPPSGTVVWHLVKPGCDPEFKCRTVVNALRRAYERGLAQFG